LASWCLIAIVSWYLSTMFIVSNYRVIVKHLSQHKYPPCITIYDLETEQ